MASLGFLLLGILGCLLPLHVSAADETLADVKAAAGVPFNDQDRLTYYELYPGQKNCFITSLVPQKVRDLLFV